nr:hypothetical protein GCM10020093_034440 [Planobispora longispora]
MFMFPGQGAQYAGMGRDLYDAEPVFRAEIDACAALVRDWDLREKLFGGEGLNETAVTQPAVFAVEYALACLLRSWGVEPAAMAGHSIGEYVAACLAGVFTREEAMALVVARGALMQGLPRGDMLAVPLAEDLLAPMLAPGVDLAAVNAPDLCVVSGPAGAVAELREVLSLQGVEGRPLHTSHAFHSAMMDPILEEFAARVAGFAPRAPSCRTCRTSPGRGSPPSRRPTRATGASTCAAAYGSATRSGCSPRAAAACWSRSAPGRR